MMNALYWLDLRVRVRERANRRAMAAAWTTSAGPMDPIGTSSGRRGGPRRTSHTRCSTRRMAPIWAEALSKRSDPRLMGRVRRRLRRGGY